MNCCCCCWYCCCCCCCCCCVVARAFRFECDWSPLVLEKTRERVREEAFEIRKLWRSAFHPLLSYHEVLGITNGQSFRSSLSSSSPRLFRQLNVFPFRTLRQGAPHLAGFACHLRHAFPGRLEVHFQVEDDERIRGQDQPSPSSTRFANALALPRATAAAAAAAGAAPSPSLHHSRVHVWSRFQSNILWYCVPVEKSPTRIQIWTSFRESFDTFPQISRNNENFLNKSSREQSTKITSCYYWNVSREASFVVPRK